MGKLRTIQRRAALVITGALASTPTDVLDVYANLLPVKYLVEKARHSAALRLATLARTHPLHAAVANTAKKYVKRHRTLLHELTGEFKIKPEKMEEVKAVRFGANWESTMARSMRSSKDKVMEAEKEDSARWKVYSDGSGIDGKIGTAAVLFCDGVEVRSCRLHLSAADNHTVYESEGIGGSLGVGLLWAQPEVEGAVSMVIDTRPAIDTTRSVQPKPSHYIWDTLHRHANTVQRKHPDAQITI